MEAEEVSASLTHQGSGILSGDLHEFFSSMLLDAAEHQNLKFSPHVTKYVTDVLVAFHETTKLFGQEGVRIPVLADMLTEAMEADYHRRLSILRQLGDTSLMVTGFFPEALSKRAIDFGYYQKMGEVAYSHLSSITTEKNVFDELSERFVKLSRLLNEVSEQIHVKNYPVSKLIEFYTNTGSDYMLEQLKSRGVIPLVVKKPHSKD